jgi:hypothetical protein
MNTTQQQHNLELCLVCPEELASKVHKRGLCTSCYEKFRRARDKVEAAKRPDFEARLMALGKLAMDARAATNVFDEVRMEIEAEKVIIQPIGNKKATPSQKRSTTTKRKAGG